MRALVTGACGFVGRYLLHELVSAGYEVLATDILETPPPDETGTEGPGALTGFPAFPEDVVFRRCDLRNVEEVGALIGRWKPGTVFHLAAQSSAARSFEDPKETLEVNVFGTLYVLEAVRRLEASGNAGDGPVRVLSIGSSDEYGMRSPDEMPLHEGSTIEPVSPYAVSKASQTMMSLQYCRAYGLQVIVTRSFSHTGPGQSESFALPSFAKQCAEIMSGIREPVIRVGNLEVVRDYLDVRDVARAYRLLIESGDWGEVYNVCSGRGLELKKALDTMIGRTSGKISVETDIERLRPADVPVLIGNNEKLCTATGWSVTISQEQMLFELLEYWERRITRSSQ